MAAGSRLNKINISGSMKKGHWNFQVWVLVGWRQRMKLLKKQHGGFVTGMHNHYNLLLAYYLKDAMILCFPGTSIQKSKGDILSQKEYFSIVGIATVSLQ
jgi:hypothetical protein